MKRLALNIKNAMAHLLDMSCIWLMPLCSFLALVSGGFLTYDLAKLRHLYPSWQRLFDLAEMHLPWVFICSAGLATILTFLDALRNRSLIKLEKKIHEAEGKNAIICDNARNLFDGILYNLAKKLDLSEGDQTRISLYIHDGSAFFIPFGRYSPNPTYRKPGRSRYPDNEGCIREGWQNGWCFENNLGMNNAYFKNNQNRYNVPRVTLEQMKMKSALYAVKRIDCDNGNSLAVLVVESTEAGRFTEASLQKALNGNVQDFAHLISTLRNYIPNPQDAQERGF